MKVVELRLFQTFQFLRINLIFFIGQVGVGALVIAYTIVGAFIFQAIEADDSFTVTPAATRLMPNSPANQTSVELVHTLANLR